jgi:hypothetical protein
MIRKFFRKILSAFEISPRAPTEKELGARRKKSVEKIIKIISMKDNC